MIKLIKTSDREKKILKAPRGKKTCSVERDPVTADFSLQTVQVRRQWANLSEHQEKNSVDLEF